MKNYLPAIQNYLQNIIFKIKIEKKSLKNKQFVIKWNVSFNKITMEITSFKN